MRFFYIIPIVFSLLLSSALMADSKVNTNKAHEKTLLEEAVEYIKQGFIFGTAGGILGFAKRQKLMQLVKRLFPGINAFLMHCNLPKPPNSNVPNHDLSSNELPS